MALTWDATACGDAWGDLTQATRDTLIFGTMFTDMGRITEDNAGEFYARLHLIERVDGALRYAGNEGKAKDVYITPEEARAAVGLHTNVVTKSWASWLSRMGKAWRTELGKKYRADIKKSADEAVAVGATR